MFWRRSKQNAPDVRLVAAVASAVGEQRRAQEPTSPKRESRSRAGATYVDIQASDRLLLLSPSRPLGDSAFFTASLEYESCELPASSGELGRVLAAAMERAAQLPPITGGVAEAAERGKQDDRAVASRFGYRSHRKMVSDVVAVSAYSRVDGTTTLTPTVHRSGRYWKVSQYAAELTCDRGDVQALGQALQRAIELCRDEQVRHDALVAGD